MYVKEIIVRQYWYNLKNGQRASIFGAVPYMSDLDKPDWAIVSNGFTMLCDDGCVRHGGLERKDVSAHANRINLARVHGLKEHAKLYPETASQCKAKIHEIPVAL